MAGSHCLNLESTYNNESSNFTKRKKIKHLYAGYISEFNITETHILSVVSDHFARRHDIFIFYINVAEEINYKKFEQKQF